MDTFMNTTEKQDVDTLALADAFQGEMVVLNANASDAEKEKVITELEERCGYRQDAHQAPA